MIHAETIATYDTYSSELAAYFAGIGSRDLIDKGLERVQLKRKTVQWLYLGLRKTH